MQKLNSLVKVAAIMFGTLLFQILLQIIFEGVLRMTTGDSLLENDVAAAIYHIVYAVTGGLTALAIYTSFNTDEPGSRYMASAKRIVILIFFGVAMQFLAHSVLNSVYYVAADSKLFKDYGEIIQKLNGKTTPLIYLYTMIFGPFIEEYIFRGLIYSSARQGFGHIAANCIQALMFALYHGNVIQGIYAFVLGMLLGYAAEHKKSMLELVALHMIVNITGIFVAPFVMSLSIGIVGTFGTYMMGIAISSLYIVWVIVRGKIVSD